MTYHPTSMSFSSKLILDDLLNPKFVTCDMIPLRRCIWMKKNKKWYRHFKVKKVERVINLRKSYAEANL